MCDFSLTLTVQRVVAVADLLMCDGDGSGGGSAPSDGGDRSGCWRSDGCHYDPHAGKDGAARSKGDETPTQT